jgi:putative RecB family exonuclease
MLKLSPTKINTYLNCPFKYKCDCDWDLRQKYHKDTPELIFGTLIHDCLDDLYKKVDKKDRNLEKLRFLFEKRFKDNWDKHKKVFGTKRDIVHYVELAKLTFKNFVESEFFKVEPFSTEEFPKFMLTPEIQVGGKFDRIDLKGKKITLIDYKTGKLKRNRAVDDFQLDFYEYLLKKTKPEYEVKEKIYYYLTENEVLRYEGGEDRMAQTEEKILEVAERINNDKGFEPTPNSLCGWCNYREICPIMQGSSNEGIWSTI